MRSPLQDLNWSSGRNCTTHHLRPQPQPFQPTFQEPLQLALPFTPPLYLHIYISMYLHPYLCLYFPLYLTLDMPSLYSVPLQGTPFRPLTITLKFGKGMLKHSWFCILYEALQDMGIIWWPLS